MKFLALFGCLLILAACASTGEHPTTEELTSEYCLSEGNTKDARTGVTVDTWDPDATTAGHRGVNPEDKLAPNPSVIRGC